MQPIISVMRIAIVWFPVQLLVGQVALLCKNVMFNSDKSASNNKRHRRDDEIELLKRRIAELEEILEERDYSPTPYSDSGEAWCNYSDQED